LTSAEVKDLCEKRAAEIGVEIFTADELRRSAAASISIEKAEAKKTKREEATDDALFEAETGQRTMARVCFPVWELGLKS
jgi:FKBP-type peptidyl-prolyl cis-trans isomerase (trigger factor)